jgi:hypothetical protein
MKKLLFFLILITSIFNVEAQIDSVLRTSCTVTQYSFSYGKPNENGTVIAKYAYNEQNQLIKKFIFTETGKARGSQIYTYGTEGKLVKTEDLTKSNRTIQSSVYQYNEAGVEEIQITYDSRGKMNEKKVCIFGNDKKNWTERDEYDRRGLYAKTVIEKTDEHGNRISGTVYDENGSVKYRFKIEGHDRFNNELKKVLYNADGSYLQTLAREWDNKNHLVKRIYEGKEKVIYTYNSNGYLETETYYSTDTDEPIKLLKYSYQYK